MTYTVSSAFAVFFTINRKKPNLVAVCQTVLGRQYGIRKKTGGRWAPAI